MQDHNTNHSTSRDYELLIHNLIEQEMSGISGVELLEILHNVKMKGLSGFEHQIDVAYRFRLWEIEILVIVECKQYRNRVGIDDLLEFRSRIEDLRAHKGILITSSGFQSGALEFADVNRIALLVVRGTKRKNIKYCLYPISWEERCKRQLKELHDMYQTIDTGLNYRVSIAKRGVVVVHDGVKITLEPGELYHSMLYVWECPLEDRSSDNIFFSKTRESNLRTDKLLKTVILDELLTLPCED